MMTTFEAISLMIAFAMLLVTLRIQLVGFSYYRQEQQAKINKPTFVLGRRRQAYNLTLRLTTLCGGCSLYVLIIPCYLKYCNYRFIFLIIKILYGSTFPTSKISSISTFMNRDIFFSSLIQFFHRTSSCSKRSFLFDTRTQMYF